MGRPPLSEAAKLKSMGERLARNSRIMPDSQCWEHTGFGYYKMGRDRRLRPRSAMWLVSGRELPTPSHLYWIGQKYTCTVAECINPEHLEIKTNGLHWTQVTAEEYARKHGGVLRPEPPDGARWGEGTQVIWLDIEKWAEYCRAKGKDEAWIAERRPAMLQRI